VRAGEDPDTSWHRPSHTVANELIVAALDTDRSHVGFEDSTHIGENIPEATWYRVRAFRRLYEYVK